MRWFTCTPVAFGGGPDFFARDSGLLCRGFAAMGIESRAVMPGQAQTEDEPDLIRTDYANLESAEWWRSHGLDGVVLYAWGRPKFRQVAAAIHRAGIFLVLNQDNGGLVSPLAGLHDWLSEQWILSGRGGGAKSLLRFLRLTLRGLSAGIVLTDLLRAVHLKNGDVIACVSPKAAEYYRKLCRIYGGPGLSRRVAVIPHPVEPMFQFTNGKKRRQVACVGRWQDTIQKRQWLLMDVIGLLVESDPCVVVMIVGPVTPELEIWHRSLVVAQRDRVRLRGRVDRGEIAGILRDSEVFYSPSAFESFGIAGAEALCAGCSVVAGRSVSMASFEWFVGENSGVLADVDDAMGHFRTLERELGSWEQGRRDPRAIADIWTLRLHADRVAARVLELAARPNH